MKTVDVPSSRRERNKAPCRHQMRRLGAHTLHVGRKPKRQNPYAGKAYPIREVRTVSRCMKCGAFRVSISRHLVYKEDCATIPR